MKVCLVLLDLGGEQNTEALMSAVRDMAAGITQVFAPQGWPAPADLPWHPLEPLSLGESGATAPRLPARALAAGLQGVLEHLAAEEPADLDETWLWLLSPAHVPAPGALPAMVRAARGSSRVAVVGPKVVDTEDPRRVVAVGHRISRWGRSADFTAAGVFDQGQFDETTDVLGVPITGMLVRASVLTEVGGVQPALHVAVAGLDLSWRAHAAGYRVLAAPDATLSHDLGASAELGQWDPDAAPAEQRRVAAHYVSVALSRTPWWKLPFRLLAMLLTSVALVALWAVARRPRAAGLALSEAMGAISLGRVVRARRQGPRAQVGEGHFRGLFHPLRGAAARARFTRLDDPADVTDPSVRAGTDERSVQAIESGPVSDEADSLGDASVGPAPGWWSWPATVAVLVAVLATAAGWRSIGSALRPQSWGVRGPEIATSSADASSLWNSWASGWSGTGLGYAEQGPVWFLPMSGWTWCVEQLPGGLEPAHSAAIASAWLLLGALPLSALTAYRAARRALPARSPRAVLALGWAGLAPLAGALDDGRLGPVVVHIVAPLVVAGVASSLRRGRSGTSAAFATTALVALGATFVPIVLAVGVLAGVVVLVAAPGWSRLRGLLLIVVPAALLGPEVLAIAADPVLGLGGAGATIAGEPTVSAASALMLHPGGPVTLAMWWVLPAWLLVIIAVADPGLIGSARPAFWLGIAALSGVATAIAVAHVVLGQVPSGYDDAGATVFAWPGSLLSVAGAAVLLAAAHGASSLLAARSGALIASPQHRYGLAAAASSVVLAIAAAGAVGTVTVHSIAGFAAGLSVAQPPLPAVVAERAAGPERVRLITLEPRASTQDTQSYLIGYTVLSGEPAPWLRDRSRELVSAGATIEEAAPLANALAALADDTDSSVIEPAPLEEALADLAVGYVSVRADGDHPVVRQLDRLPTLVRVTSGPEEELWRVRAEAAGARVWWQDESGARLGSASVSGVHATGLVRAPNAAVSLAVAQPPQWADAARVSVGGEVLTSREGDFPSYRLPAGGQEVQIELPTPYAGWWWASALGGGLLLLLSAPVLRPGHRS